MRRVAFALALMVVPALAYGQSKPVFQSGTMVPGDLAKFFTNGLIGDAKGLSGDVAGKGVNPFAITDLNSTGLCTDSAATTGGYRSLCIGHDSNGNAVISVDGHGGLSNGSLLFQIGGVNQVVPGSISGIPVLADTTIMQATASTYASEVIRADYATGNGAPPVVYRAGAGACTLNAGAGDGGSQIPTSDGKCWLAAFPSSGADASQWGVLSSATNNSGTLQKAIDWACTNHTRLHIAAGSYNIATQVTIGNGTSGSVSTQSDCAIEGGGGGTTIVETIVLSSVKLVWTGGATASQAIKVAGPIGGLTIKGIQVDCADLCGGGFDLEHPISSHFWDLSVYSYTGSGYVLKAYGTGTGAATGAQHNDFLNVKAHGPTAGSGAYGITVGQSTYTAGDLDPAQNTFTNCSFEYDNTVATSAGIFLQYTDNDVFIQTSTLGVNGGGVGNGIRVVPPTGTTLFPGEVTFTSSAIIGGVYTDPTWAGEQGLGFFPWVFDAGTPPACNFFYQCYGIQSNGIPFGLRKMGQVQGSTAGLVSLAGATVYAGAGCNANNAGACVVPMTKTGHILGLSGSISDAGAGGSSVTVTAYLNGSATTPALACTIANPATTCVDSTVSHIVPVTAGDILTINCTGSAGASASAQCNWSVEYD